MNYSRAESIWLVGSRASKTAATKSDWDLLVFASVEPEVVPAKCEDVDVIRVGSSRETFLLEGKGLDFLLPFSDWWWR
jgi:predicted nucleotidyltransferase